ncbi:MAG: DAK2 domain-containing protein, partial [Clostridia bacterium]|nr:DAK2 domain-containing protein [Clostridia bacterium]
MSTRVIDGKIYSQMLYGGAAMLSLHANELNSLNVFPVADGDTGTNMLKTIEGGLSAIEKEDAEGIGALSKRFSRGVLLSARGNSGVILSQIFAGINEVLEGEESVTVHTLAKAYIHGIEKSYAAVQNPTEGTILTVFRESTEYAADNMNEESSLEDFYRLHIEEARRSLAQTKNILPALAEADVVDSGAAGYLYIAEGMNQALEGKEIRYERTSASAESTVDIDRFTRHSVLEYGYCTEFLLRLTTSKVNPDAFEVA